MFAHAHFFPFIILIQVRARTRGITCDAARDANYARTFIPRKKSASMAYATSFIFAFSTSGRDLAFVSLARHVRHIPRVRVIYVHTHIHIHICMHTYIHTYAIINVMSLLSHS